MAIAEPTTFITDYALAAISAVFGILLLRGRTHRGILLWSIGFQLLAAGGITGGTFHGFRHILADGTLRSLWNITMLLVGASAGFMISAAIAGPLSRHDTNTRWLAAGVLVSVAGLVIQQGHISIHPRFNHNDLFHCVQIVSLCCLYKGARLSL
jgi:hypothetical protein